MTEAARFIRRNRVNERNAALIAAAAGLVAAIAGAEPTGTAPVDLLIVVLSVGVVVWAAASAPWWAAAGAAGIAAAVAVHPIVGAVGAIGFLGGLHIGLTRRDQSELRAVVAAIAVNCLIRSDLGGFHGSSALIGVAVGVFLLLTGLRRRPSAIRRVGRISIASLGGLVVFALAGLAISGNSARPDISAGARQARQAITTLNTGDYDKAAEQFDSAAAAFRRADGSIGGVLAAPSRLIPGIAQNVGAGADLSSAAADGTARAAAALRSIDVESLRVVDGVIDIDAVRAAEGPLADVQQVLYDLQAASVDARSPWLLGPLRDELADLDERLATNEPRLGNAIEAVKLAPRMLGSDGPRRYMVMFTSPVEARGLAGFMGNYGIVTIDGGRVDVGEFGRRSDLDAGTRDGDARCDGCPPEMLARYGSAGLDIGDGSFGSRAWTAMTMPSHFPFVGEATQIMYPQSGGQPIDGVIAMDPFVVQALMRYVGPIELTEAGVTVRPRDAAQFLLEDQYLLLEDGTNAERIEAIDTLGQQVIDGLLTGALPVPSELARDLGPLVAEQRLLVWTDDPAEQALLDRIGMLGALPALGDDGGFSVVVTNQGRSKIDAFLDRTVETAVVTADDGTRTLVADVTLHNDAPTAGLPRYVIGNGFGLPEGSSYLWVNFFGPEGTPTVTRNGNPVQIGAPEPEAGWWASPFDDVLGPGETVTYRVEYSLGPALDGVDAPVRWDQPLARRQS